MNESGQKAEKACNASAVLAAVAAVETEDSARATTIRGTVWTADGKPAKRAKVWTARLWTKVLDRRETLADELGRFTIDVVPGEWLVWACLGTHGEMTPQAVTAQANRVAEPITITLTEAGILRGRLVEAESGQAIPGAHFTIDNALVATGDNEGRFEVVGLSRCGYHEAFVTCPGRARMRVLFVMSDRLETDLEVRVPRAGKIVGCVADEQGRPIPGALIGRSTSGHSISTTALFVRSNDDGRFEYDGVFFDRPTRLGAEAEGYQGHQKDSLVVDPRVGSLTLDFQLARAPADFRHGEGKSAGLVRDAPSEQRQVTGSVLGPGDIPVVGAVVRWGVRKFAETVQTLTDANGRFDLGRVPDQDGVVTIMAAGSRLAPSFAFVRGRGEQDVQVSLVEGRSVRGIVQDDLGGPFAGVSIIPVIFSPDPNQGGMVWLRELDGRTDAQGRFELSGLPGTGVKFDFLRNGLSDLRNQILELDGPDNAIMMQAGGAIRGRVVDPEGQPVRNFRVLVNGPHESRPGDKSGGYFAGFRGIGLTYTSDDGTFVVKKLVAARVQRLSVMAAGYGEGVVDRAIAEPENRLSLAEPVTVRLAPPYTLRVHAVEAGSGLPIADARVCLIYDHPVTDTQFSWGYHDIAWGDDVRTRTGPDGWAEFQPLSFSEATLLVQAAGYGRCHLGWRNRATEVTVELKPEAIACSFG